MLGIGKVIRSIARVTSSRGMYTSFSSSIQSLDQTTHDAKLVLNALLIRNYFTFSCVVLIQDFLSHESELA